MLFALQLYFRLVCRGLASPSKVTPLLGGIVEMVRDPYGFWERQRALERNGVSKFMLLGKLVLFSTDTDVSRRILTHTGPDALLMARRRRRRRTPGRLAAGRAGGA